MTIYFAATENEAFGEGNTFNTPPAISTSSSQYDSDFSRCAIRVGSTRIYAGVVLPDLTDCWVRGRLGNLGPSDASAAGFIQLENSSGQGVLRLTATNNPGSGGWYMQYWNGSSWDSEGTLYNPSAAGQHIDVECIIDGSSGRFAWYVGGTLIEELTGDTDLFGSSSIAYVSFYTYGNFEDSYISEVVIADEDTRGMRVASIYPTGVGSTGAWTGAYTDVDETDADDADYIESGTASQVSTFAMSDLAAALDDMTVEAFIGSARIQTGAGGPQNCQIALRTDSTDYYSSNLTGLTTSFKSAFQNVWETNPDTASEWTIAEIEAIELGLRSIA